MSNFEPSFIGNSNPNQTYKEAKQRIKTSGSVVEVRGKKTRELLNATLYSEDFGYVDAESVDEGYIFREISNIWRGLDSDIDPPEWVINYLNPDSSLDNNLFWGPEVREALQKGNIMKHIDMLKRKPKTRRSIVDLSTRDPESETDYPCLVSMHIIRRDHQVNLQVHTRSSDINLGVPFDYYLFQTYHSIIASKLSTNIGNFIYRAISLHDYITED